MQSAVGKKFKFKIKAKQKEAENKEGYEVNKQGN